MAGAGDSHSDRTDSSSASSQISSEGSDVGTGAVSATCSAMESEGDSVTGNADSASLGTASTSSTGCSGRSLNSSAIARARDAILFFISSQALPGTATSPVSERGVSLGMLSHAASEGDAASYEE